MHSSPLVKRELVANYSLLYTVTGSDPSLQPYLLVSHLDVVPVEREKWTVEPFDGITKDGYIYGRGTLDVKDTLMVFTLSSFDYLDCLLFHVSIILLAFSPTYNLIIMFIHFPLFSNESTPLGNLRVS